MENKSIRLVEEMHALYNFKKHILKKIMSFLSKFLLSSWETSTLFATKSLPLSTSVQQMYHNGICFECYIC